MEILNTFIIILSFIIIYFVFKNMLPSYFGEKGKNLATKGDISEITEKVEAVKQVFTTDNEKLKSNLHLLTNSQIGLYGEERNAIVDYNQKLAIWINVLTDSGFGGADLRNDDEIAAYKKLISNSYSDLLHSEAKFKLFVDNIDLVNEADNLKILVLDKLGNLATTFLLELKYNNKELNSISLENEIDYERKTDERIEYLNKYHQGIRKNMGEVVPQIKKFIRNCKTYLYRLIKNG